METVGLLTLNNVMIRTSSTSMGAHLPVQLKLDGLALINFHQLAIQPLVLLFVVMDKFRLLRFAMMEI